MIVEQIYTECLSQASYYIESDGEAVVIDPTRDTDLYISLAKNNNATIKYIFETHFHADFVSGHCELANKTGAEIVFGTGAKPAFKATIANDGDILRVGEIEFKVLHTPGHTLESCCFLMRSKDKIDVALFTGDTLFVNEVGRPDLLSGIISKEEMAAKLFHSLHDKIMPLADDIIIYPGHGPGSACGRNLGKELSATLGEQKLNNYALKIKDVEDFINSITSNQPVPPAYFFKDVKINIAGPEPLDLVVDKAHIPLDNNKIAELIKKGVTVLDTRSPEDFAQGHIPGSIYVGLDGQFAIWVGTILEFNNPIVIVSDEGREREAIIRLARIGYDNIEGYYKGELFKLNNNNAFLKVIPSIGINEVTNYYPKSNYVLLDVRDYHEANYHRIRGSINIPLNQIKELSEHLNIEENYVVHCVGGYRSMIAASLLLAKGFKKVLDIAGGIDKVQINNADWIIKQNI